MRISTKYVRPIVCVCLFVTRVTKKDYVYMPIYMCINIHINIYLVRKMYMTCICLLFQSMYTFCMPVYELVIALYTYVYLQESVLEGLKDTGASTSSLW